MQVMLGALTLFEAKGYEATTVDEIADAAGISRRTFFRQFRAKEDVVFVDHDLALAGISDYLAGVHPKPRAAVADAAVMVFDRFADSVETTERRYQIVKDVPVLRDREIVMTFRYEGLFSDYLRRSLTGVGALQSVQFAAAVTATHNYLLRRFLRHARGSVVDVAASRAQLRADLAELIVRFERSDEVVVAVFPRGSSPQDIVAALTEHL